MKHAITGLTLVAGLFATSLAGAPAASAHAFLDHAIPAVGSTVATAPREIRLLFTEAVEPHFSAVTLAAAGGKAVATGAAAQDPHDKAELVLHLPALGPGRYTVAWHVVSVDTHRTQGHFTFTIGR
jgi:copper resistance protein C